MNSQKAKAPRALIDAIRAIAVSGFSGTATELQAALSADLRAVSAARLARTLRAADADLRAAAIIVTHKRTPKTGARVIMLALAPPPPPAPTVAAAMPVPAAPAMPCRRRAIMVARAGG